MSGHTLVVGTDADAIRHLEECPWCWECNALLDFYATCDRCGHWGNKVTMTHDGELLLCENCADGDARIVVADGLYEARK